MNLETQVKLLSPTQVSRLQSLLIAAGIRLATGKEYKSLFRNEKYKHPFGAARRIYKRLERLTHEELDGILTVLITETQRLEEENSNIALDT
jgi:hypothetical protein